MHDAVGVDVQNGTASLQNLTLSNDGTGFTASNVVAVNLSDLTLTNNATAGGTISNVTSVNDTPSSGDTGVTTTITGGSFQSGANQAVSYTNVKELNVTGSSGADTFNVTPSAATTITIHGELPTPPASPGDTLAMNLTGAVSPKLMDAFNASTGYSGAWTFGNKMAVIFDGIETLTPSGPSVAVLKTSGELDLLAPTGALKEISPAGTIQAVSAHSTPPLTTMSSPSSRRRATRNAVGIQRRFRVEGNLVWIVPADSRHDERGGAGGRLRRADGRFAMGAESRRRWAERGLAEPVGRRHDPVGQRGDGLRGQ